jgi:uncharacterized repeat protein (TIGR01451 family)
MGNLRIPELNTSQALLQSPIPTPSPLERPQLSLTKTVDNDTPSPGDVITYTLSYSASVAPASDVVLYDFLPAGVQLLSTDPPFSSHSDGTVVFNDADAGTEIESVTIRARVLGGYERLYNHAVVAAECATPTHTSLLTYVVEPLEPPLSALRLTSTGYPLVFVGGELVYTLRCENIGHTTIDGTQVIDVLPTGAVLMNASPMADAITTPTVQWSVGNLGPGAVWESTITVTAPSYVGTVTNTVFADAYSTVMTQTLFATRVVTAAGILQVSQEAYPARVPVWDDVVYTLTYTNAGNRAATGIVLTDTFPADIAVIAYDPAPVSITPERGVWELGSLAPGEWRQVIITATVGGAPDRLLHNLTCIAGDEYTFPAQSELFTPVEKRHTYLPLVFRQTP